MSTRLLGEAKFFYENAYLYSAKYSITIREDAVSGIPTADGFFYLSERDRQNGEVVKWTQVGKHLTMQLDKTFELANIKKDTLEVFPNPAPSFAQDGKCNITIPFV